MALRITFMRFIYFASALLHLVFDCVLFSLDNQIKYFDRKCQLKFEDFDCEFTKIEHFSPDAEW